jgi:hypothetical protein
VKGTTPSYIVLRFGANQKMMWTTGENDLGGLMTTERWRTITMAFMIHIINWTMIDPDLIEVELLAVQILIW